MGGFPLVSVILPTYNHAEFLKRAIDSVLSQTYPNWELIIWDDGSTDDTAEIVGSYDDNRLKYHFDVNHGVAYARNNAINFSLGHYLAFLDSDDQWRENKLLVQVDSLRANPDVEVLFTDYLNVNLSTKEIHNAFSQNANEMKLMDVTAVNDELFIIQNGLLESLAAENFLLPSSVMIRRETIERVGGFSEELQGPEDFELWWRMGLAEVQFAYINEIYVTRLKPPGSLSSPSLSSYNNRLKALDLILSETMMSGRSDLVPCLNKGYRNVWHNLIIYYGVMGKKKPMLKAFFQSLRYGFCLGSFRLLFEAFLNQ